MTREAHDITHKAGDLAGEAAAQAKSTFDEVKSAASGVAASVQETASDAAVDLTTRLHDAVIGQKASGAKQIDELARAAHGAARELEEESPQVAGYVREAAAGLEKMSRALHEQSLGEILDWMTGLARRQPAAFFAGSVLAGVAVSRLMKSSAKRDESPARSSDTMRPRS